MRISAKGRYALAALIYIAQLQPGGTAAVNCEAVTVAKISERLGISKIYLEQTFSLLKRAGLVSSVKGAQGGYFLTREPSRVSALDILSAIEAALLEETDSTAADSAPHIDSAIRRGVAEPLDQAIRSALSAVSLAGLAAQAEEAQSQNGYMFFI